MPGLKWLPRNPEWKQALASLPESADTWASFQALADADIDFIETGLLDRHLERSFPDIGPEPLRLAILSSCTIDQLLPSLRIAALRRGLRLNIHVPDYGQYRQALFDPKSSLSLFNPQIILFAIDARALVGDDFIVNPDEADRHVSERMQDLTTLWRTARDRFGAQIIQQTPLPTFPNLLGGAEHMARGSPATMINIINREIRVAAIAENVDILAVDDRANQEGLWFWYNPSLWNLAKQEISHGASPMYGELALRLIAARRGRSAKCLVLDLDNTIWGGVVGDEGIDGIVLGQGSADGEAFLEFQRYAKALSRRGVILAVCSKNDEANALEAFEKHPEMVLRREDIAAFLANWDDKASNLRRISAELNIGSDSLVFADDNPFERNIVRRELPEVHVPEMPEEPSLFASTLADAGYFEAIEITKEDFSRRASYQATQALRQGNIATSDLENYLASLNMELVCGHFDSLSLKRVTQLINKTNQFNLTTRRYTEAEVAAVIGNQHTVGLYLRLVDRFADHGIIGVVIGHDRAGGSLEVDCWLMSCRVLGRGVEDATLSILVGEARRRGNSQIVGRYRPSAKNGMVRDLYARLGFNPLSNENKDETLWALDVTREIVDPRHILIKENPSDDAKK
jgi:FkbH-like protein